MEGMHILEQTPIKEHMQLSWIFLILGVAIAIGAIIYAVRNNKGSKIVVFCYIVGIVFILLSKCKVETGHYTYTCTFDDNVTANDVSKNFNIVNVENDIWTVEDKENK